MLKSNLYGMPARYLATPPVLSDGDAVPLLVDQAGALITSGGSSGSSTYDIIVPDDYPTLTAALGAATTNQSIFIRSGSYVETGGTFSTAGLTIQGSGRESALLTLNNNLVFSGNNVTILGTNINTNGKSLNLSGQYAMLQNNHIKGGSIAYFLTTALYGGTEGNIIEASSSSGRVQFGDRNRIIGNHFIVPHVSGGGIYLNGRTTFSGNYVHNQSNVGITGDPLTTTNGEWTTISDNVFFCANNAAINAEFRCTISANAIYQGAGRIVTTVDGSSITGNVILINASNSSGIYLNGSSPGYSAVVTGNNISDAGQFLPTPTPTPTNIGIELGVNQQKAVINGNSIAGCETGISIPNSGDVGTLVVGNAFTTFITAVSDSGTSTLIRSNQGIADN